MKYPILNSSAYVIPLLKNVQPKIWNTSIMHENNWVSEEELIEKFKEVFEVTEDEIRAYGKSKKSKCKERFILNSLLYSWSGMTNKEIAEVTGTKEHTSIIYSRRKAN